METTCEETICVKCSRNCNNIDLESAISTQASCDTDSIAKCQRWLMEKCSVSDVTSECDESVSSETTSRGLTDFSEDVSEDVSDTAILQRSPTGSQVSGKLSSLIQNASNTYGKIKIKHSKDVLIGNATYITGPIHIVQNVTTVEEQNINQSFLNGIADVKRSDALRMIPRRDWLAQPPLEKTPLPEPVKYVVICHTASEEGFTNAENVLLVRLTQSFHIDSRKWDDIAYNFLIGSDGNVYEGRGWGIQGAFAFGYNRKSVGIAFVGCFLKHLPPPVSLKAAKALIEKGIELGAIPEDYTLVGHCQCSAVESPGRKLFEEIQTWPRWRKLTSEDVDT